MTTKLFSAQKEVINYEETVEEHEKFKNFPEEIMDLNIFTQGNCLQSHGSQRDLTSALYSPM